MKIGLSYSHCIVDILDGNVDIDQILVIISATNFDVNSDEQWRDIMFGYTVDPLRSVWSSIIDKEKEIRSLTQRLVSEGKLHQPRMFGSTIRSAYRENHGRIHWLDVVIPDPDMEKNPTVKQAWDHYCLVAGLAGMEPIPFD